MQKSELPNIRLLKKEITLFNEKEIENLQISNSVKKFLNYVEERNLNGIMPLRKDVLKSLYESGVKISESRIYQICGHLLIDSYSVYRIAETFGERIPGPVINYKMPRSLSFVETYVKNIAGSHYKFFSKGFNIDAPLYPRCLIAWSTKNDVPVFSKMFSYSEKTE